MKNPVNKCLKTLFSYILEEFPIDMYGDQKKGCARSELAVSR